MADPVKKSAKKPIPSKTEHHAEIEEEYEPEYVEERRAKDQHRQPHPHRRPRVDDQNRERNRCHRQIDPGKILRPQRVDEGSLTNRLGREVNGGEYQKIEKEQPGQGTLSGSDTEEGAPDIAPRAGGAHPSLGEPALSLCIWWGHFRFHAPHGNPAKHCRQRSLVHRVRIQG